MQINDQPDIHEEWMESGKMRLAIEPIERVFHRLVMIFDRSNASSE
jgi:hypothetical protein